MAVSASDGPASRLIYHTCGDSNLKIKIFVICSENNFGCGKWVPAA